jgi:hypothetical protein
MRKNLLRGLFALVLVSMSTQAFAGNVDACDFLKDKLHPDYAPGLYGLCVAWNNASANGDQVAMDQIAGKFADKSGGLTVPGSSLFACPCWVGLTDVRLFDFLELLDESDPDLADVYTGVIAFTNSAGEFELFGADPELISCGHTIDFEGPTSDTLSPAQALICGMEIGEIRDMHATGVCPD